MCCWRSRKMQQRQTKHFYQFDTFSQCATQFEFGEKMFIVSTTNLYSSCDCFIGYLSPIAFVAVDNVSCNEMHDTARIKTKENETRHKLIVIFGTGTYIRPILKIFSVPKQMQDNRKICWRTREKTWNWTTMYLVNWMRLNQVTCCDGHFSLAFHRSLFMYSY